MGIMSKNNRLPERPKPPTWTEITEDIGGASNDDVVFSVGKDNLAATSGATTPVTASDKSFNSTNTSLNSSGAESTDSDVSQVDPEKVRASYSDVVRLISLYTELKDAPVQLQEHYSHLKEMGTEMNESISELKALAQNIVMVSSDKMDSGDKTRGSPGDGSSSSSGASKGKPKQKKKK